MTEGPSSYELAGVNIKLGDELSDTLYDAAKQSWANREGRFGQMQETYQAFSSFRAMPLKLLKRPDEVYMSMGDDGIGTKVEIAERVMDHSTIAYDLFAMACDDAVIRGAEPIALTSTLDIRKLEDTVEARRAIAELAAGYIGAAAAAQVAVINGEVAELGDRVGGYGDFNYNWSCTVMWVAHQDRILDGSKIRPGDALVALEEPGMRSNGISLVRRIWQKAYGDNWHEAQPELIAPNGLGKLYQTPSRIYTKAIVDMTV